MAIELTRPLAVIDYAPRSTAAWRLGNDYALLLISAGMLTVIGLAILAGVTALLVNTWPMIGLALVVAVPIAIVGLAFLGLAWTAVRSAFSGGAFNTATREGVTL